MIRNIHDLNNFYYYYYCYILLYTYLVSSYFETYFGVPSFTLISMWALFKRTRKYFQIRSRDFYGDFKSSKYYEKYLFFN